MTINPGRIAESTVQAPWMRNEGGTIYAKDYDSETPPEGEGQVMALVIEETVFAELYIGVNIDGSLEWRPVEMSAPAERENNGLPYWSSFYRRVENDGFISL